MFDVRKILYLAIAVFAVGCQPKSAEPLIWPQGLGIIELDGGKIKPCLDCENKVVVFHNFNESQLVPFKQVFMWKEHVEKYPDISFLIYASGDDIKYVTNKLTEYEFPISVFHDPEFSFYKANNLDTVDLQFKNLIAFLVVGNKVVDYAAIGMPEHFDKQLRSLNAGK
ncbi:hypothetical protein [Rhodonellum sp.]|uniref:hypothetical protein n=1 Tax=Rhodonellum sp. TaxID=2231180 RepID=UPI0027258942|nr:hypothetical protein [Rhodonellum sp.]MDO9551289.1 hypothetical protein [Rhodonellum sp.]